MPRPRNAIRPLFQREGSKRRELESPNQLSIMNSIILKEAQNKIKVFKKIKQKCLEELTLLENTSFLSMVINKDGDY